MSSTFTWVVEVCFPELLQVGAEAAKLMPVTFAPFTVTAALAGLKVNPVFVGVTVWLAVCTPEQLSFLDGVGGVLAVTNPLSATGTPGVPLIVPANLPVGADATKFI